MGWLEAMVGGCSGNTTASGLRGTLSPSSTHSTSAPSAPSTRADIILQQYDPLYSATARHFADLGARYSHPCVVLNLLRAKERRCAALLLLVGFLWLCSDAA